MQILHKLGSASLGCCAYPLTAPHLPSAHSVDWKYSLRGDAGAPAYARADGEPISRGECAVYSVAAACDGSVGSSCMLAAAAPLGDDAAAPPRELPVGVDAKTCCCARRPASLASNALESRGRNSRGFKLDCTDKVWTLSVCVEDMISWRVKESEIKREDITRE